MQPASSPRLRFVALGGLTAIGAAATDMYIPAFPAVCDDLNTSATAVQASVAVFLLGMAIGQLLAGSASDALGRRRFVLGGAIGFGITSAACATATGIEMLIGLRALQGLTAAAAIVVARAVVQDEYGTRGSTRMFSKLVMITGLAPVLAPSFGAVILQFLSWRWIFVAQAVLAALLAAAAFRALPETLPPEQRSRFTIGFVLGRNRALLRNPRFVALVVSFGLASAIVFAYVGSYSFVVQDIYGQSPRVFALIFGANAIGMVAFAQANGWLAGRTNTVRLMRLGLAASTLLAGVLLVTVILHLSLIIVVATMWLVVASRGFIMPNLTALVMETDPNSRGSASALLGTLQWAAGAVALPLAGLGGRSSAVPMAIAIFAFSAGSLLVVQIALRRYRLPAPPSPATASSEAA